ncbi:MAG TPA: hypothetical protein PLG31_09925 [Spirochaetota bacterium]|nr:hypothetical protein [Spirochaetota bacterium]
MNYTIVKQFWNNSVDNFYNFFYKIVDFFKIWIDVWWAFFEIWQCFFLIFFNFFMYFYYLFLFMLDRSATESQSRIIFWKKIPQRVAYTPAKAYVKDVVNPIPGMYGAQPVKKVAETVTATTAKVADVSQILRKAPSGGKVSIIRRALEGVSELFRSIKDFFAGLFKPAAEMIGRKMKHVDEEPQSKSLIDEYMREYERKKKRA